jgi:hypothetical protein
MEEIAVCKLSWHVMKRSKITGAFPHIQDLTETQEINFFILLYREVGQNNAIYL